MGLMMGSREAIEVLVKDKATARFGLTDWGGEDYPAVVDGEGELMGAVYDDDALEEEDRKQLADRGLEVEDKLKLAYLGGYGEKYTVSGNLTASARLDIAQRTRALRAATPQPKYKGDQPMAEYILPKELKAAGYRLERDDSAMWWARGRGRHVSKGNKYELGDMAGLVYDANADLDARGGPAKPRGKKAKEEAAATALAEHMQEGGREVKAPEPPTGYDRPTGEPYAVEQAEEAPEPPAEDDLRGTQAFSADPDEEAGEPSAEELAAIAEVAKELEEEALERETPPALIEGWLLPLTTRTYNQARPEYMGGGGSWAANVMGNLLTVPPGDSNFKGALDNAQAEELIAALQDSRVQNHKTKRQAIESRLRKLGAKEAPALPALPAELTEAGYRLAYHGAGYRWEWAAAEGEGRAYGELCLTIDGAAAGAARQHDYHSGLEAAEAPAEAAEPVDATPRLRSVAVGSLQAGGDLQSREQVDYEAIAEYQEAMGRYGGWGNFPAVRAVYDGVAYWVYDGQHRLAAFKNFKPHDPGAVVPTYVEAGDRRKAILLSTGVNTDHGVRRTRADKAKAVTRLLKDEEWRGWSDAEIARHCKVDPKTVGNIRKKLEANREIPGSLTRRTADGHTVTVPPREPVAPIRPAARATIESKPPKVVYTEEDSLYSDMIGFGEYLPLISAGFVLERRKGDPDLLVRWAWPQAGGRAYTGEWEKTAVRACDKAVAWYKNHAPAIEANLAVTEAPEPPVVAPQPPDHMIAAGYTFEARGIPLGSMWSWQWTNPSDPGDWVKGNQVYDMGEAYAEMIAHYDATYGEAPAVEEEAPAEAPEPVAVTGASDPDAYYRGFNAGFEQARALPALPEAPGKEERREAARYCLELYRDMLNSLTMYERLTGKFAQTPPIRRALEPTIADLKSLLKALGEAPTE